MKTQIIFTKQEAIESLRKTHNIQEDIEIVIQEHGVLGLATTKPYSPLQHPIGCMCSMCSNLLAPKITC